MKFRLALYLLFVSAIVGCATGTIEDARQALYTRFVGHSVDDVLLAWGAPQNETKLTDGTRLITYRRMRTYWREGFYGLDYGYAASGSSYGDSVECDASFLAPPPKYIVTNVSLDGDLFQCQDMAYAASGTASPPTAGGF